MKKSDNGQDGKKISVDELESLKDVLVEADDDDTQHIPTLSDVVKEEVVQARQAAGENYGKNYDDRLNASLEELRKDTEADIPVLSDIANDADVATPFELVGGALTAPVSEADKKELYAQMEQEAERLLDEIVSRHMPMIRDELMVRLEDVKQTLLDELQGEND